MKLKVYLATIEMTAKEFADLVQCDTRYLSRIMNGHVKPGKRLAQDIEDLTDGQVKFLEKKQDSIQRI